MVESDACCERVGQKEKNACFETVETMVYSGTV